MEELKRWLFFIMMNTSGHKCSDEIIRTSLIRARTLEKLADKYFVNEPSSKFFLLGMFSMIDALIGRPIEEILHELPIDLEVKEALLLKENKLAEALKLMKTLESGNWTAAKQGCIKLQIDDVVLFSLYQDAVKWSDLTLKKATSLGIS